jgi:short-subunit dehydrogenase
MDLKPLDRQVMLITGASSGIGLATALEAAHRGARLMLVARSAETLAGICEHIADEGGEAIHAAADVGDKDELAHAAKLALDRYGRIDTWVNDAGVSIYGRLDHVSDEDNRRLFETNFWGVVYGSLIALPILKRQGGALINVGSEVSEAVVPLQGMYSASKHAVKGFTDALRVEVEDIDKAPVSITLIQPTAVNTPYPQHAKNYMPEEPRLPRPMIDAREVADAILEAATKGGRDVKVGTMSKLDTTLAKLAPGLGDKLAARQAGRQHYAQPPNDPDGTLFRPGHSGRIDGERPATP